MTESMVGKNYLMKSKVSFLIMSFIIIVMSITVQNDIWPFLQTTTLPVQKDPKQWALASFIMGMVIPGLWLLRDWSCKMVRYSLLSLLVMFMLQVATELIVSHYFFISMAVPTAILYVGYRIIQLLQFQRVLNKTHLPPNRVKSLRVLMIGISAVFWSLSWIRLTFIIFPQIIYQII